MCAMACPPPTEHTVLQQQLGSYHLSIPEAKADEAERIIHISWQFTSLLSSSSLPLPPHPPYPHLPPSSPFFSLPSAISDAVITYTLKKLLREEGAYSAYSSRIQ